MTLAAPPRAYSETAWIPALDLALKKMVFAEPPSSVFFCPELCIDQIERGHGRLLEAETKVESCELKLVGVQV